MGTDHKSLISYQKAKELTKKTIKLSKILPYDKAVFIVYSQLIRAASSIGANIVEGYGRNNPKEYKQFLGIARGSSLETEYWLEILSETISVELSDIIKLNQELIKILTVTIKNLGS